MDLFKFVMLMLYAKVHVNVTASTSNGTSNGNSEDKKGDGNGNSGQDVEIALKNLPDVPPGFHFVPSPGLVIADYLVKKILGAPLASDMVIVRDGIQQLDPEQHKFKEEFAHCRDNEAYYITTKGERKTTGGGESQAGAIIIETPNGYWRETKKDIPVYNNDDLVGYKKSYVYCHRENGETSWKMDELTVNPEIIPANAQNHTVACRIRVKPSKTSEESSPNEYEDFEEEEEEEEIEEFINEVEVEEEMGEVVDEN